jgi:hypothetical protein
MPTISPAQNEATRIDISRMAPGLPPDGFTFWRTGDGDVGEWLVLKDPTAISGQAIAQASRDPTDYRFPLAIYKPISAKNVDVVVRFKPIAGKVDQAGGIVVRLTTPDDYYVVRANALEDNVGFYRVVKGQREQNLFIVDGSIWVTSGGVNPTSTIQALALCIADSIKKRLATLFD